MIDESGSRSREKIRKRYLAPRPRRFLVWEVVEGVVTLATANPWYGCKKIAVMSRHAGEAVTDQGAFVGMRVMGW